MFPETSRKEENYVPCGGIQEVSGGGRLTLAQLLASRDQLPRLQGEFSFQVLKVLLVFLSKPN
jgi:hypothetical protein